MNQPYGPDDRTGGQRYDVYGQPIATPLPPPPSQGPYPAPLPYGYSPYGHYQTAPQTSGLATAALVLGITSLVCGGLLLGIPAMIMASQAKRAIDRSGGRTGGRSLATAGFWTGLVGTVLAPLALLLIFALGGFVHTTYTPICQDPATGQPC
jgi:hypothetical protein